MVVATISEKSVAFAGEIVDNLRGQGLRVELDDSPERIGPKKHRARKMKVPYIAVVGEQEVANRSVNVNDRDGRQLDDMGVDDFLTMLLQENRPQAGTQMAETAGAE